MCSIAFGLISYKAAWYILTEPLVLHDSYHSCCSLMDKVRSLFIGLPLSDKKLEHPELGALCKGAASDSAPNPAQETGRFLYMLIL